jgi:hypothetical protein
MHAISLPVLTDVCILFLAHELRAWLIHYSPVVLFGILPEEYYQHHLLLSESIFLLSKDIVKEEDIAQSSKLLMHYCCLVSILYGELASYSYTTS